MRSAARPSFSSLSFSRLRLLSSLPLVRLSARQLPPVARRLVQLVRPPTPAPALPVRYSSTEALRPKHNMLSEEDDVFAYTLAANPLPARVTPEQMAKAARLYGNLMKGPGPSMGYLPQLYLQRAILNYPKWHCIVARPPDAPEDAPYLSLHTPSLPDGTIILTLVTDPKALQSTLDKVNTLGNFAIQERPGPFIVNYAQMLTREDKLRVAVALNPFDDESGEVAILPLEKMMLYEPAELNEAWRRFALHWNATQEYRLLKQDVETIMKGRYQTLFHEKKNEAGNAKVATVPSEGGNGRALVLTLSGDGWLAYTQQLHREDGVSMLADMESLTLPEVYQKYVATAKPGEGVEEVAVHYGFKPKEWDTLEKIHLSFQLLDGLGKKVGVDLLKDGDDKDV